MAELRALIFDVDGTLADTEGQGHLPAFNQAFAEAGLGWYWSAELYRELLAVAGGKERMLHYIRHHLPPERRPPDAEALVTRLHAAKNRIYEQALQSGRIALRSGVARLLEEARRAGILLAIATTSVRSNVVALLRSTLGPEAESWFAVMATADEVQEKKPSPRVYEYVLEHLSCPPEGCLVLEDSENGLRAARAAALETLICVNAFTRNGDYSEALLVVDRLGEPEQPARLLGGRRRDCFDTARPWVDLVLLRCLLS